MVFPRHHNDLAVVVCKHFICRVIGPVVLPVIFLFVSFVGELERYARPGLGCELDGLLRVAGNCVERGRLLATDEQRILSKDLRCLSSRRAGE
jgi:hypothetical protein